MSIKFRKFFTALVVILSIVSCGKQVEDMQKDPSSKPLKEITIAQFGHVFLYLPLYVANQKGFFEAEGLKVNLVSTGGDEKTFAAVVSKSAQFGVADPAFVAIAAERGQKGKVIASLVNGVTFWGITFDKNIKEISSPNELTGKKIAVYTAPSTNYAVMQDVLKNSSGNHIDAKVVQGSFGSLVAMLKGGHADIAMELEPIVSIAVAQGAKVVYSLVDVYGDFSFTGITATDEYINSNPQTVQAVVNAIHHAVSYVHSDFNGALDIASKEFPSIERSILRKALQRLLDDNVIPESVVLKESAWKNTIKLRKDIGDLKGNGEFKSLVDNSFSIKAAQKK